MTTVTTSSNAQRANASAIGVTRLRLGAEMPWVHEHRRRVPYSWFRSTTVRRHYRRPQGSFGIIVAVIAIAVVILLIALLA